MSEDEFLENLSDTMDEDEQDEDEYYDEDSSMEDEHEGDIFDTGDDGGFGPIIPDKQRKRPYEVEFKVYSIEDIVEIQEKEVENVSVILGVERQHAATLLRHMRWNSERLFEKYIDNREHMLHNAGVIMDSNSAPKYIKVMSINTKKKRGEYDFVCEICCDDDPNLDTLALSCQHRFCSSCYIHYLTQKIREEGESRRIQCPQDGCKVIVDEKTIKLVVDSSTNDKYRTLLNRTYVDDNDSLRWCPAPSCEYAIECHVSQTELTTIVPTVTCMCGHRFCFGCGYSDHQPSICVLVKKWLKKCEDDSETANWISAHTKECPQCISTIEKNGGCNHLTCRKCKHEFCWVCLGPWSEHGTSWYNCNRYDEKSSSEARDAQAKSRASLERYLHYYNRFTNHDQSAKLDKEVYLRTEAKMQEMQETSDLSWIQVQFLRQAVDILMQARATLKWTYAFAFYLAKGNMTEIFEDNQRDLEMATENLSEMLERPIEKEKIAELRQEVLNKMGYVEKRREVVLEDTVKGLKEGRWSYFIDLK